MENVMDKEVVWVLGGSSGVYLGREIDKEENCKVGAFNWVHQNEIQI